MAALASTTDVPRTLGNMTPVARVRDRLGAELFRRVAGPDGPKHRERIHDTPGPRWFPEDSPIARVHGDAAMFVGGIRAVLLQTMHPAAMTAVAEHSGYRGDMWGRLARTSRFIAVTTFGTDQHAQQAVDVVRSIHDRVSGTLPDGTSYAASDPHLLLWVHVAEVDSFLTAHQAYGKRRSTRPAATSTSRRRPSSPASSACSTHRGPTRSWPRRSSPSGPSSRPPTTPVRRSRSWSGTRRCPGRPGRRTAPWWPPRSG